MWTERSSLYKNKSKKIVAAKQSLPGHFAESAVSTEKAQRAGMLIWPKRVVFKEFPTPNWSQENLVLSPRDLTAPQIPILLA